MRLNQRKIYFYRINYGNEQSGKPKDFDASKILNALNTVLSSPGSPRYMVTPDGKDICVWVDDVQKKRVKIGLIRRRDLPQQEENGMLSDLSLAPAVRLAELSHIIFFDNNIVGVEFNYFGPKIARLSEYLLFKKVIPAPIAFYQLLKKDILREIDRFKNIKLLDLRIYPSYASTLKKADSSLAASFKAASEIGSFEETQIVLKRPTKDLLFNEHAIQAIKNVIKKILSTDGFRENSDRFLMRGVREESGKVETLDLLGDKLISVEEVVTEGEKSRAIVSESAYQAIQKAYDKLNHEFEESPSISLSEPVL